MTTTEVLRLHDKGLTAAQIARRLNVTQHRVESILDRDAEAAGPHGSRNGYCACRCRPCTDAVTEAARRRASQRKALTS